MQLTPENTQNFSPSCERNKQAITEQLKIELSRHSTVLEIGTYSAQHAMFICEQMPHITWQPSDQAQHVDLITKNLTHYPLANINTVLTLDVSKSEEWPKIQFDTVFTANTLHIMSQKHVELFFKHVACCIKLGGKLCIYGPFKYKGDFTSDSNAAFNQWLKDKDELSAIRDFELVNTLAMKQGLTFISDTPMPANNQFIVWQKT